MKLHVIKVLLIFLLAVSCSAQAQLQLNIVDGKTDKSILQIASSQKSASQDHIDVQVQPSSTKDGLQVWRFTIKNNSSQDRWLYLNWQLPWQKATDLNRLHYWSGQGAAITGQALSYEPVATEDRNTTMLQAVYDDEVGVALALPPAEIVSAFKNSFKNDAGKYFLELQIPLVLSPSQSDTFPIEVYHFQPRYGYLDALQQYFAAHPAAFNTRKDIDPRAAGTGGSRPYLDLYSWTPLEATEKLRRFGGGWDWIYAPFRRTGDIYTRDEFWNYEPARKFNDVRDQPSAAVFRANRHKMLSNVIGVGAIGAFYVPSFLYAETQLAKEQYPGAIIYKPDGSYAKEYTTPWVTGQDNELALYPWGNKFAEQSMKDARQLVAENDIYAFGYDIMGGGMAFRGEGMKVSPRRAFDKDGEYVDTAVGLAKIADFTRSLEKNGKKVGLVGNTTSNSRPFLAARSDTFMMEQTPYYEEEYLYAEAGAARALRYAAGHKAVTVWTSWRLPRMLKTDEMTPEQLRAAYRGIADYMRLSYFYLGAYPSISGVYGIPRTVRMLPLLKEVVMRGWQAVPAVRGTNGVLPQSLWTARYGNDLDSFITLGNAQKTTWKGKIVVDNDYLGESNYLFVAENSGKVLSQKINGRTTELDVEIPSHDTLVLRSVAAVPASAAGDATVTWNDDGATGTLTVKGAVVPTRVLPARADWKPNGQKNGIWNFTSNYFSSPAADLQEFPYFTDNVVAQILLPQNASPKAQIAAERIQNFFKFWGKYGTPEAKEIVLPILYTGDDIDRSKPIIEINAQPGKVQRQGNVLKVSSNNLEQATLQLLKTLDQKYFFAGTLTTEDRWRHQDTYAGQDAETFKKAGLAGKTLDPKS